MSNKEQGLRQNTLMKWSPPAHLIEQAEDRRQPPSPEGFGGPRNTEDEEKTQSEKNGKR
jgi:hypothetical protein